MKVQLSDENKKIKDQLILDFRNTRLTTDINKDIVNLVVEMTVQAIQLSQNKTDK